MSVKTKNGLPMFSQVPSNAATRSAITVAIRTKIAAYLQDDELFAPLTAFITPEGVTGHKFFDQCRAAEMILAYDDDQVNLDDAANGKRGPLSDEYQLNEYTVWKHLEAVLRKKGFVFSRGRVLGLAQDLQEKLIEQEVRDNITPVPSPEQEAAAA